MANEVYENELIFNYTLIGSHSFSSVSSASASKEPGPFDEHFTCSNLHTALQKI